MVGCSKHTWFSIDGKGPIGGDLYEMPLKEKLLELSSVNQLLSHYKQVLKQ
jgi:hypothetical protein